MDKPSSPQWSELVVDVKMKIISMLDLKTRKILRSCSFEDKQLVDRFPYRKQMTIICRSLSIETGKWYCRYSCCQKHIDDERSFKNYFDTCQEAYEHVKKIIKTAETVTELCIRLKSNSKVVIRDGRKLVNVKTVYLFDSGGENIGTEFRQLLNQINLFGLEGMILMENRNEPRTDPLQGDRVFELEKTMLSLDYFLCLHVINDEQLLGIRANSITLMKSNLITPSGFVRFIQKKVLAPPSERYFQLTDISSDLQVYLLGGLFNTIHSPRIELIFNMKDSDYKLHIYIDCPERRITLKFSKLENNLNFFDFSFIHLLTYLSDYPNDLNNTPLRTYPTLRNLVNAISDVLPPGFPLM